MSEDAFTNHRSSTSDSAVWTQIEQAIDTLEVHLAMAINHPGALPVSKRAEIEQRLNDIKMKIAARDSRGQ